MSTPAEDNQRKFDDLRASCRLNKEQSCPPTHKTQAEATCHQVPSIMAHMCASTDFEAVKAHTSCKIFLLTTCTLSSQMLTTDTWRCGLSIKVMN